MLQYLGRSDHVGRMYRAKEKKPDLPLIVALRSYVRSLEPMPANSL